MNTLFVGNLPYEATEAQLRRWFTTAGIQLESVSVQIDRFYGRSRGFAYVASDIDIETVIRECNGRYFRGRTIIVSPPPSTSASRVDFTGPANPF